MIQRTSPYTAIPHFATLMYFFFIYALHFLSLIMVPEEVFNTSKKCFLFFFFFLKREAKAQTNDILYK